MFGSRCLCNRRPDQGGLPDTDKWDTEMVGLDSAGPSSVADFLLAALNLRRRWHNIESSVEHVPFGCFVAAAVADDLHPLFA